MSLPFNDVQAPYGAPGGYAQPNQYGAPEYASSNMYGQPNPYAQQQQQYGAGQQAPMGPGGGGDAFMTGFAGSVLRQSGENYLQRGQAFMQSRMSFMSTESLHYYYNLNGEYVRSKLLMLLAPFLRRWNYSRVAEQISGGHKYLPPKQDVNAPDLYIPAMAVGTYCLLLCLSAAAGGKFKPEIMTSAVSSTCAAWAVHVVLLTVLLYLMGIPSAVPFLETVAYAGYPFVPVCVSALVGAIGGRIAWHVSWLYGSVCMAVFMVRTIKRVIFHEARQYRVDSSAHNYVLLGLALLQFPFMYYLGIRPGK